MILTGDKLNYSENYPYFEEMLSKTIIVLNDIHTITPFNKDDNLWKKFEHASFQALKKVQENNCGEPYSKWGIELISGHKFPDITAEIANQQKFGIEVKTTQDHKWSTLGGSIMESTRVDNVERINILFATLNPFEIRTRRFEDCVSDVSITHSPRYVINLDTLPDETIFRKMGTTYEAVWKSQTPFNYFRDYFKEKAKRTGTDLWFIYDENKNIDIEELPSLEIKFYADLSTQEKQILFTKIMLYTPEIFARRTDDKTYKEIALYLLNMGIINTSLRDMFSAGSITLLNDVLVPSKLQRLINQKETFLTFLSHTTPSNSIQEKYQTNNYACILEKWKELIINQWSREPEISVMLSKEFENWHI